MQRLVLALACLATVIGCGHGHSTNDVCPTSTMVVDGELVQTQECLGTRPIGDAYAAHRLTDEDVQALRSTAYHCAYIAHKYTIAYYDPAGCVSNGYAYRAAVVPTFERLANGLVKTIGIVEPNENDLECVGREYVILYIDADDLAADWRDTYRARATCKYDVEPDLPEFCRNPATDA